MPYYSRTERMKNRLRKLGYTQQELAEAIGYSRSYVTAVLNGRRAPDCLALAEAQVRQWMDEAAARRR
ncbi:MAG: helix-turn-helix transcriptional regulator [Oscillospiraceae bacterium]|nr:helix-turn-helix transcriptional regulator [Oscillospiraceae bacterium]